METQPKRPIFRGIARPHYKGADGFSRHLPDGFTPHMLRYAYSYDKDFDGTGMTVAVICALDNVALQENMRVFCNEFSLPLPEMEQLYPFGRAETTSDRWLIESSLDTQWVHVFAPGAKICTVFAKNANIDSLLECALYACDVIGADVVSMSFGTGESTRLSEYAESFSGKNCILTASSGDIGSAVSFPSSLPFCISVGGTEMTLDDGGKRKYAETAWQNSGGGKSTFFHIPVWQERFSDIAVMSKGMRACPDVSMYADERRGASIYVSQLGGWATAGGTSLSNACFAGVAATVRQKKRELSSSHRMLEYLYKKAGETEYLSPQYNYYDVIYGSSGKFVARRGWDFCTGLGSPVIKQLLL